MAIPWGKSWIDAYPRLLWSATLAHTFLLLVTMRSVRRISFVLLSVLLLSTPLGALARQWGLPDSGDVDRGTFIRAAVEATGVSSSTDKDLPYSRVPTADEQAIRAAYDLGALAQFGKDLGLSKPIKRGEAVQVVFALLKIANASDGETNFRDVLDATPLARAVDTAVDRGWIAPQRSNLFGINRMLTPLEAEKMLMAATGSSAGPKTKDKDPSSKLPTIKVNLTTTKAHSLAIPKGDIMEAIWKLLNDEYLYSDKVDAEEAAYRAIEGLVNSVDDPYTSFLRPAKAKNFRTQLQGEVTGIGAQVEDHNGVLTIVTPLRGSPAERAGLLPGDEIISADGAQLTGIGFNEAVDKVRGPKGSTVKLTIRRSGTEFEVSVQRDTISVPEVEVTYQENVAIVRIMQFGEITEKKLRETMQQVAAKNPKGVILDLRNNPGGLERAATVVASNFLPKDSVVSIIKSKAGSEEHRTEEPPTIDPSTPVILLVNGGSASASEIVAGAMQDAGRAKLVGEKTFGKGTVQAVLQFKDGSSLKMTIAQWLTPKSRVIDKVGITPDVTVKYSTERDEQLLKALELLRR